MKRLLCAVLAALLLCGCAAAPAGTSAPETTVPVTTSGPVLKPGFYICDWEQGDGIPLYFRLFEDGTGYLSMLAAEADLTWTPDGTILGITNDGWSVTPTADGMLCDGEEFTWVGDSLPEGFIPEPPAPGVYAVSSVSRDGDLDFYGSFTRDNGYFELKADGTGILAFDDAEYPFTMEGTIAKFDGWDLMLLDMSDQDTGGPAMVMVYVMDGPLNADSIAFRKLED